MTSRFTTKLNIDIRFLIYDFLFQNHTIEITNEQDQNPLTSLRQAIPELKPETTIWEYKQRGPSSTTTTSIYGFFLPATTLFTCALAHPHARHALEQLACDTHSWWGQVPEDIRRLRIETLGVENVLGALAELEIFPLRYMPTLRWLEIVVGKELRAELCGSGERDSGDGVWVSEGDGNGYLMRISGLSS